VSADVRPCAAVLLDVDGVLVDTDAAILELWAEICVRSGRAAPGEESLRHILGCSVEHTSRHLFPDATAAQLKAIGDQVRGMEPELRLVPVPGAAELIDRLHRAGVPVALVTGASSVRLGRVVAALQAAGKVTASVTWGEAPGKPDPGPYLLAARRIGVRPGECVALEDAAAGVLSAVRSGATCIGLARPGSGRHAALEQAGAVTVVGSPDQVRIGRPAPRPPGGGTFAARLLGDAGYLVTTEDTTVPL
jgi:HAD superfamily hydrolase (TIGR01509 family)